MKGWRKMSKILEAFKIVAPYISELSVNDVAVTIADKKVLY